MSGNAELVLQLFRAGEERDATKLFALYQCQIEFHDAPSQPFGESYRGFDAVLKHARAWQETWDPLQTNDERRMPPRIVAVAGDEVVACGSDPRLPRDSGSTTRCSLSFASVTESWLAPKMFHFDTPSVSSFLSQAAAASR